MSSSSFKNFKFMDRLRSKSFDKAIITGNNLSTYYYIDNFDTITEEECIKIDIQNREIYKKNIDLYDNIAKQIEHKNAMFKIDTPPSPPAEPSNHERFISHRIRNITRNVRHQSYAINYLLSKGYKLIFNQKENRTELEFEPFEAIDLFEKLENMNIDVAMKKEFQQYINNSPIPNRKSISMIPPYHYNHNHNNYNYNYNHNNDYYNNMNQQYNLYPQLSSSAPSLTTPPSPSIPSAPPLSLEIPKNIISAPPASHFIHHS